MLLLTLQGESQLCSPIFWVVCLLLVLLSFGVVWWLRKGLTVLPASRLLPVEYGTVTSTQILGGLIVYQEHRFVSKFNLWMMFLGLLLILIGCARTLTPNPNPNPNPNP